jgi:hypothetical protein
MDKVNAKGKSSVSSVQRKAMMATLVKMLTSVPIVGNLIWPPLKTIKVERNISYPEARKFVSVTNDSSAQKSYASVTKPVFTSVETQTDITWLNKADKPTRLMDKNTEKIVNSSKKVTNSSQTRTTTTVVYCKVEGRLFCIFIR